MYLLLVAIFWVSDVVCATDPFVGKWKMNVKKSRYVPGTCPKSMVINMEAAGDGVRYYSKTTYANGRFTHSEYTADYNGTQVIVMGDHGMLLPVSLKRLDSNTVIASYTSALQIVARSRRVVSKDGRIMRITTTSTDRSGKIVTSIGVYERAGPAATENSWKGTDSSQVPYGKLDGVWHSSDHLRRKSED